MKIKNEKQNKYIQCTLVYNNNTDENGKNNDNIRNNNSGAVNSLLSIINYKLSANKLTIV